MPQRDLEETIISGRGRLKIAVIPLRGVIVDDPSSPSPMRGGSKEVGARVFEKLVERLLSDKNICGTVLKINSPGGMATASEALYTATKELQSRMSVVAYVESVCASGAYMTSVGADLIVAPPAAIIGSIGVILHHMDISEGLAKIGVKAEAIKSAELKDAGSMYHPLSNDARAYLQEIVDESFVRFKTIVLDNRRITDVGEATSAKVFHAQRAKNLGLIDVIGNFEEAKQQILGLIFKTHPEFEHELISWIEFKRRHSFLEQALGGLSGLTNPLLSTLDLTKFIDNPGLWYIWRP